MKSWAMLILILAFANAKADVNQQTPWSDYQGCYQTISLNGQPVVTTPQDFYNLQGYIGTQTLRFLVDTKTLQMTPVLEFRFFKGYDVASKAAYADGNWTLFQNKDNEGLHFQYDGKSLSPIVANPPYILHIHLDLQTQTDGTVRAFFSRRVDGYPDGTVSDVYVLQNIMCQ